MIFILCSIHLQYLKLLHYRLPYRCQFAFTKGYDVMCWCKVHYALLVDYMNFIVLYFPCTEKKENVFVSQ